MSVSDSSKRFEPIPCELPEPFWPVALGLAAERAPAFFETLTHPDGALWVLRCLPDTSEFVRRARERMLVHVLESARRFVEHELDLRTATAQELRAGGEIPSDPHGDMNPRRRTPVLTIATEVLASGPGSSGESDRTDGENREALDAIPWMGCSHVFDPPDTSRWGSLVRILELAGGTPPDAADTAARAATPAARAPEDVAKELLRVAHRSSLALEDLLTPSGAAAAALRFADRERLPFDGFHRRGRFLAILSRLLEALADTPGGRSLEFDFKAEANDADGYEGPPRIAHVRHPIHGDFLIRSAHGSGCDAETFMDFAARRLHLAARHGRLRPWTLVLPPDALLWAGPALAELARLMRGLEGPPRSVIFPCRGGFMRLA